MPTKFESFLTEKKIDPRRLRSASAQLEKLRLEDRRIRLAKRQARSGEDAAKKAEAAKSKPRSGRPLTDRAVTAARTGKPVSGPTRTRLLKAVNHILEQKKQEKVDLRALFELPKKPAAAESAETAE